MGFFLSGQRQCYQSIARFLLRGCDANVCALFPLLRCFTPHCTPTTQLGIKMISIYFHRLSHCYLYGERCNVFKNVCSLTSFVISLLWAVLDVRASSLNVA